MPARKPQGLSRRHGTKAEKDARIANEEAMGSGLALPKSPPARLAKHELATAVWRRIMRMYGQLEATIVTGLDADLLIDYCILTEQVHELDKMRTLAVDTLDLLKKNLNELPDEDANSRKDVLLAIQTGLDKIIKVDGRADRKRDLLHKFRQSLYLTPRARAGAAPQKKESEEPMDDMERFLNNVKDELNKK